jgi:hypothetical protein
MTQHSLAGDTQRVSLAGLPAARVHSDEDVPASRRRRVLQNALLLQRRSRGAEPTGEQRPAGNRQGM